MSTEDDGIAGGDFVEFFNEHGALGAQAVDHKAVMHDFVTHVDWRAEAHQGSFDDLDGPLDAGAEAARIGEQDFFVVHDGSRLGLGVAAQRMPITSTSNRMDLPASG